MKKMKKNKLNYLLHPISTLRKIRLANLEKRSCKISDEKYIKKQYFLVMGHKLNLDNPQTFSEKMQWLKLHYHNPLCTTLSDKIESKKVLSTIINEKYIPRVLGVWDSFDEIDFDSLPDKFVLKTNHDCGGNVICLDKKTFNYVSAKDKITSHLKTNYYWHNREWPYKNIKPRVFAEEYLESDKPLVDYKFYCFGGKPVYFMYSIGEYEHKVKNHKFDLSGKSIDYLFKQKSSLSLKDVQLPSNLDEMIEIVNKICADFPQVRIDLFNIHGTIFIGEITFFTNGGYVNIFNNDYDKYLGSLIPLTRYE